MASCFCSSALAVTRAALPRTHPAMATKGALDQDLPRCSCWLLSFGIVLSARVALNPGSAKFLGTAVVTG